MDTDNPRARVAMACEVCRKRKRKCDGAMPKCSWCLVKDTDCNYVVDKPKKRKPDPDYIATLEAQAEALKAEVRRLGTLVTDSTMPKHICDILEETHDTENAATQVDTDTQQISEEMDYTGDSPAIHDISELTWRLRIDESGETTFIGPSGNFCFPVSHPPRGEMKQKTNTGDSYIREPATLRLDPNTSKVARHLVSLFITFVNPIHQFVDVTTLRSLEANPYFDAVDILTCTILAAGALFSDDSESKALGDKMAHYAESAILQICRQRPCVETVQALSILCWRELGLDNENMAWMYNSMAASLALHLGLTVSSQENLDKSGTREIAGVRAPSSQPLRIRALWSTLLLDGIATSMMGRNCIIPWRRVEASTFATATLDPSQDEINVCPIGNLFSCPASDHQLNLAHSYAFRFNKLDEPERFNLLLEAREHLLSFYRQLDPHIQLQKDTSSPQVIFLHMSYNMSQLLIHRPYVKEPVDSAAHRLSLRTMSIAASAMVRLLRRYEKIGLYDKVPPFVVHNVLSAAVTLLLMATAKQSSLRSRSISRFRVCISALEAIGCRWSKARQAILILRQLAQRWRASIALPMHQSFPLAPQPGPEPLVMTAEDEPTDTTYTYTGPENDASPAAEPLTAEQWDAMEAASAWQTIDHVDFIDYGQMDLWALHYARS
ncbi:Zn(2)-C6 fungal-type domain-containing protein [Fusarium sp. LHS14.1]|nr:Zn(2)-C6 fungal-type domain-containing protein [Fusarium sp. LHS14.1]